MALLIKYEHVLQYTNDRATFDETLKHNFPDVEGVVTKTITSEKAYIMVTKLEGDKNLIKFNTTIFKDETKDFVFDNRTYEFIPDTNESSGNFIKQAYEYLKTLTDYYNAIDC